MVPSYQSHTFSDTYEPHDFAARAKSKGGDAWRAYQVANFSAQLALP
jgi:hypothetical protein